MNMIPFTTEGWIELCILMGTVYVFLLSISRIHGTKVVAIIFIYMCCITALYSTPYTMLVTLIPYGTLLLISAFVIYLFTSKTNFAKQPTPSANKETSSWLSACLKTILNHPARHTSVTLLIDYAQSLQHILDHTPLSLAWNQELFTSILYDPHTTHRIFSFTQKGILKAVTVLEALQKNENCIPHIPESYIQQTEKDSYILCIVRQEERTCTIIHSGTILAPKNIIETIQYITTLIHQTHTMQEGVYHGARHEKQDTHNHTT